MKQTIFFLEGRGGIFFYHFFILNLGGLYYILNNIFDYRNNDSLLLDDKSKIVNVPSNYGFPIKIHMKNILPFHKETFKIIDDTFELVEDLNDIPDYEIVSIYGEKCQYDICENPTIIFPFIRNLFLSRLKYDVIPGKRIFITRKNNESYHNNVLKRYILNENIIIENLKQYNFEFIQLEDYSMVEKIKLFMESETIISSHSGSLTLCLFSNNKSNIIEIINKGTNGFPHNHYIKICQTLGLNYNRYSDIEEDINGNFNLCFNKFELFLKNIIKC